MSPKADVFHTTEVFISTIKTLFIYIYISPHENKKTPVDTKRLFLFSNLTERRHQSFTPSTVCLLNFYSLKELRARFVDFPWSSPPDPHLHHLAGLPSSFPLLRLLSLSTSICFIHPPLYNPEKLRLLLFLPRPPLCSLCPSSFIFGRYLLSLSLVGKPRRQASPLALESEGFKI